MEDFTSSQLQLILGVKEGCHFDRVQKPTIVLATLNGHCLQTNQIPPDCNPQYASNLSWETDKNAIRKMRCNQTPIKVECYAVNDNGSREKLGYILLSVRCAQLIHQGEESKIKMNWHTVLGVRSEFNNCKPKLMLYLIIKEKEKIESSRKNKELLERNLYFSNMLPKWLPDEHLIQLGPMDSCQDIFVLTVITESLVNLNQFIQEFKENEDTDFIFTYNIFETFFKLKPVKFEADSVYLNQKIVIKLRTTLSLFTNYLSTRSHFSIKLKNNNLVVAQSEINLKPLLTSNYLDDLKQNNRNAMSMMDFCCVLMSTHSKESKGDYRRDKHDQFPVLKVHVKLSFFDNVVNNKINALLSDYPRLNSRSSNHLLLNEQNYIDGPIDCKNSTDRLQRVLSSEKFVHFNDKETKVLHSKETNTKSEDNYRSYCFHIYLHEIKFLESKPDVKSIEFRFYHPQGDIITKKYNNVIIEENKIIKLEDVTCKLHFISTPDKIEELLSNFAPKISVCDSTSNEKNCIGQASLDIKKLFAEKEKKINYETALIDCQTRNDIGFFNVTTLLEDSTVSALNKLNEGTSDALFDNDLAYKIVDELETWKERQKELFKEELQRKEEVHLTLLNEEWQRRRQCIETKLAYHTEQCKTLGNSLQKTIEDLRKRKIQSFEKETKLIQANEELQWKYERKLRQLQDAVQKMQDEFSIKLRSLETQNQNLIIQIETVNAKNYELEKLKSEQTEKLSTITKVSLNEDQTTSVLQQLKNLEEKLDNAQKSKSFFKEQWDDAVKEIHRLKMENQKALECQIKSSKEELHNLDLEEILHADSAALTYDQRALTEIQREIEVLNSDTNLHYLRPRSREQLFAIPQSELCLNLRHNLAKSDVSKDYNSSESKLRVLIEERDALLKTGSYSIEDAIIIKLNAEIRSLLINS